MQTNTFALAGALCLALAVASSHARRPAAPPAPRKIPTVATGSSISLDQKSPARGLFATAAPSTTYLATYDFDGPLCDPQGWTAIDFTAQDGDFTHVEDFAGLGGGDFGNLYPIEGNQSVWCGARPSSSDPVLCSYAALPGYGNNWDQGFCTASCLEVTGDVVFDYVIAYYSEPGYDFVDIEYDECDDQWVSVRNFSGEQHTITLQDQVPQAAHSGDVRWRVRFRSDGAWSDEDGLWNTDGAFIIDSLTVYDATGTLLPTELFEAETPGDHTTVSGNWTSCPRPGYGDLTTLFPGSDVLQQDPCYFNASCIWGFFAGSTANYSCGGYPGQTAFPYEDAQGEVGDIGIISPPIAISGTGTEFFFEFDVYRNLPLDPLVFYSWSVQSLVGGCVASWQDREFVYWGDQRDWFRQRQIFSDLVDPAATELRFILKAFDMCPFWCGTFGSGQCHTQGPLFDNVSVYRVDTDGPQWFVSPFYLFQDNFAADGTTTGTVRADIALDILPNGSPNILPGDSVVVNVADPEGDLAGDAYTGSGPAVYAYVGVWPQGQPGKSGTALTQDAFRWPVVDSLSYGGDTWYCVRMDTVFNSAGREYPSNDRFCVDLNDNLFTPGDTICFVFSAKSDAPSNTFSYWSEFTGQTLDLTEALDKPMEMTCLPTGAGDMLYVDAADGLGVQPFFDTATDLMGITEDIDRYDVRRPTSSIGNGPASRVVDVFQQLTGVYRAIAWSTGTLRERTIGDGNNDKSDDAGLLYTFLDNLPDTGCVWFSGDNIAEEWATLTGSGAVALRTYLTHNVVGGDHAAGPFPLAPLVIGVNPGPFTDGVSADSLIAYGGCPEIRDFDILEPTGTATAQMLYGNPGPYDPLNPDAATIMQTTNNSAGFDVHVVLDGYGFDAIRDDRAAGVPDRAQHFAHAMGCAGILPDPTDVPDNPFRTTLAQNYPNPFNPTTTIGFTLRDRARVSVKVYNVAGQLVRTLVNDERAAGVTHTVTWDGMNSGGQRVASGVYFYRLVTDGFTKTRKMVLLK